jgi:hypothetical protein
MIVRFEGGKLNGKVVELPEPLTNKKENYEPDTDRIEVYILQIIDHEPVYVFDHMKGA